MRGTSYAWAVIVPNDEDAPLALLSAASLRKTKTTASILAVVASGLSAETITKLNKVFDWLVIGNGDIIKDPKVRADFLTLECWKLTTFTRVVVLKPGVMALSQADDVLDMTGFFSGGENNENYLGIALRPNKSVYTRVASILWVAVLSGKSKHIIEALQASPFSHEISKSLGPALRFSQIKEKQLEYDSMFPIAYVDQSDIALVKLDIGETGSQFEQLVDSLISEVNDVIQDAKEDLLGSQVSNVETQDWISIVGMSCRFPDANNLDEYWDLLINGRNTSGSLPLSRNTTSSANAIKGNFLKCHVGEFDAPFFGISPAEMSFTDPQTRLLLETSWEALEDAGINPEKLRGSTTGVFYGSWMQEYKDLLNGATPATHEYLRKYLGNGFGATAAKLSFFYGLTGPNQAVENGCSSSLVAVDLACKSLNMRECPVAIAAGANLIMHLSGKTQIWTEDGICKTFDITANGYGRSEGVAVLILKRYADAVRDGDIMHGIIRGCGVSQEGLTKSFGSPTVESESAAMKTALDNAKLLPHEVDYIEAHATGTNVGDPIEASAITKVYAGNREKPLVIGSGKTNIGHTESCSGLAGMFKVLLALKHEVIPPHINLKVQNPKVSFDSIPGVIPVQATPWLRSETRKRIAGVSSFGITGTDAHVLVQEPPKLDSSSGNNSRNSTMNFLAISAKSEKALEQLTTTYKEILEHSPENIIDISYTANACRAHHPIRVCFTGKDRNELWKQLSSKPGVTGRVKSAPKICFTFPGYTGRMSFDAVKALYLNSLIFKLHMDHCDTIVQTLCEGQCMALVLSGVDEVFTTENKYATGFTQAFMISAQYSLTKMWEHLGINPDCVVGHCLGELTAAIVSGALSLHDGLEMIVEFMKAKDNAHSGIMMAINADSSTVAKLGALYLENNKDENGNCNRWLDVACINAKDQTTVAGSLQAIQEFKTYCIDLGHKCNTIPVDLAIHSRALEPITESLTEIASRFQNHPQKIPYISSVVGSVLLDQEISPEHWMRCFRNQVNFVKSCQSSQAMGFDAYLDIGFSNSLPKLTKMNQVGEADSEIPYLSSLNGTPGNLLGTTMTSLSKLYEIGFDIHWEKYYDGVSKQKISLPSYPFQRKAFWFDKKAPKEENGPLSYFDANSIHPLLGAVIPNATGKEIFQNAITKELTFVYDHCISTEVIYPAAGHLEMMLSSGCIAFDEVQTDSRNKIIRRPPYPIKVEDFTVHQPLHVIKDTPKKVQTVLDRNEDGSFKIQVFSENPKNKNEWASFASGTFSAISDAEAKEEITRAQFDLLSIKDRCPEQPEAVHKFYEEIAHVGLIFGKEFKSIVNIHSKSDETLAAISIPGSCEGYILHPILSDALFQVFIFHTIKNIRKLHVPVKVGKFISFPRSTLSADEDTQMYVYCSVETSGLTSKVYLLDKEGHVVGVMMYPELIATSAEAVLNAAGCLSNAKLHPSIYEQYWKAVGGPVRGDGFYEPISSSCKKWIILHYGMDDDRWIQELLVKLRNMGRECYPIPVENLELIISQGGLQHQIDTIFEENKHSLEGILFLVSKDLAKDDDGHRKLRNLVEPLVAISKFLIKSKLKVLPKLQVVTSGAWYIGDEDRIDELNPLLATLWGYLRTMRTEIPGIVSKSIDFEPGYIEWCDLILEEILNGEDKENEIVYRNNTRHIRRLRKEAQPGKYLSFPESRYFGVHLPETKILADLKYVTKQRSKLTGDEVEIEIRTASLNFKDVLNIMKPTKEFEAMKTIGLDYSGVITAVGDSVQRWKVGDPVFGCSFDQGTIASHLVSHQDLVAPIPTSMTFSEAATLPAVFLTAWYCMVDIANLKAGQTILIHAASGGVGLVAIQIAKLLGVHIIGTAGSSRKRNFIKSLGVEHVFSSRNLEYGQGIKNLTGGKGVDMVLNCLTGPGFKETSLDICKEGGHFTEISKVDIWQSAEVTERKPSVHYNIVYMPDVSIPIVGGLLQKLTDLLQDNFISPLPFVRYDASKIVDALTYLQKAKQIGKVVVEMPFSLSGKEDSWEERIFNGESTYIITGGFGDIGLAVANWMVEQGAKYLILLSRREPNKDVNSKVEEMEAKGATVLTRRVDISDYSQCERLLSNIKNSNLPPVRGIQHCAGVISDCMISKQDWTGFEKVYAPKVGGAYNLHRLTRDNPLEFFVLYSSLTSTFGNIGQANYTSANAYMDALAELRHAKGLKVLNINWGQWDAGMAKGLELYSAIPFSVEEGINALEKLMRENKVSAMAADVNFRNLVIQCPYLKENLLEEIEIRNAGNNQSVDSSGKDSPDAEDVNKVSLLERYVAAEESERAVIVQNLVATVASRVLGLAEEEIDFENNLSDMGMDSLMSIEFTNNLQSEMGEVVLGFVDMDENGSVVKISEIIEDILKCESE